MRCLILIFMLWSIVQGKPEMYKEKEDFKYSRSSSDDGSKSGYYGAQRGNMGGNYERAHNMDGLAQHQMSGLVTQVEGELGDSSKAKTGSVFSSANSRGIYGSGNYDLTNLEGRNFAEGASYGNSQSSSSQSKYAGQSSRLASHSSSYSDSHSDSSRYDDYHQGRAGQVLETDDQQFTDLNGGHYVYGGQAGSSRYVQSGSHRGSDLRQQSVNNYGSDGQLQTRLISGTPARVIIRPGTRVTVPVAAQTYGSGQTYGSAQTYGSGQTYGSAQTHDESHRSSLYDQRSEAESLRGVDHQISYSSSDRPKHYESSASYRKEWEKHDSRPMAAPLSIPSVPTRTELYDYGQEAQISDKGFDATSIDSGGAHSRNGYRNGYSTRARQSLGQSRSQYESQQQESGTDFHADSSYGSNSIGHSGNLVGAEVNSEPKSYQSSYAYHKSWERQGDPYVIVPSTSGDDRRASQRLTSDQSYESQPRKSQAGYLHGCSIRCEESAHLRVSRSADYKPSEDVVGQEELGQQLQTEWGNVENLGQQVQSEWDQLEDLGQQSQSKWDEFGQQTQTDDQLLNFDQQSQLEDFDQQTQTNLEESVQQKQRPETSEQQTQHKVHLPEFIQKTPNTTDKRNDYDTRSSDKDDKSQYFDQQTYNLDGRENVELQETQNEWHDLQQTGQQTQNTWDHLNDMGQHDWDKMNTNDQHIAYGQRPQQITQEILKSESATNGDHVKPVWEQTQDVFLGMEPKVSSESKVYQWGNIHGYSHQQTGSSPSTYTSQARGDQDTSINGQTNWQEVSHDSQIRNNSQSLQNVWGMIEKLDKESSQQKETETSLQHASFDWSQTQRFLNDSTSSQSSRNHYRWEITPKTNKSHDITIQSPRESGRGDIAEAEDTAFAITTEKSRSTEDFLQTYFSNPESKYKNVGEIESLSIKNNETQISDQSADNQQSDRTLSVLSIQDWLNHQRQHESSLQSKPVNPIVDSETHDKVPSRNPVNESEDIQKIIFEQAPEEIQHSLHSSQKVEIFDQQVQPKWEKPKDSKEQNQGTWDNLEDLGQKQDMWGKSDFGQEVQTAWDKSENFGQKAQSASASLEDLGQKQQTALGSLEDLGQKQQTAWGSLEDLSQKQQTALESSADFRQKQQTAWGSSEDLGQKQQNSWGNSENLGQQMQNSWRPSDTLQHQEEFQQHIQHFDSLNKGRSNQRVPDFYEQSRSKTDKDSIDEHETIASHKFQNLQDTPGNVATEVSTTEVITEKPGFWKSVGGKLSNAKDKVYSWFRRS